jgi:hypothetical protein
MTQRTLFQNVRRRLPMYLEPSVAACAGLRLDQLQQIVGGTYFPTDAELNALARRLQLMPDQYPETGALA